MKDQTFRTNECLIILSSRSVTCIVRSYTGKITEACKISFTNRQDAEKHFRLLRRSHNFKNQGMTHYVPTKQKHV